MVLRIMVGRARPAESTPVEEDRVAKARIVIADDEPVIRMDLREQLTSLGYQVVGESADGRSAIEMAKMLRPELVIMDIKMPEGQEGIEAARELTGEKIAPVLLLTAYANAELVEAAKEAGVVNYLVKPYREVELLPAIEVALSRFQEFRVLEQENNDLKEAIETRKIVERAKGVLMDTHGLKEAEAFQRIRKASMDSRKPMRQIAEAILLTRTMEI
jgi:two-component system, response regulator PdtaR